MIANVFRTLSLLFGHLQSADGVMMQPKVRSAICITVAHTLVDRLCLVLPPLCLNIDQPPTRLIHLRFHRHDQAHVKPEEPQYNIYQLCMRGLIDKVSFHQCVSSSSSVLSARQHEERSHDSVSLNSLLLSSASSTQIAALVDAGADVNVRDEENITCLHWAAINNRHELCT